MAMCARLAVAVATTALAVAALTACTPQSDAGSTTSSAISSPSGTPAPASVSPEPSLSPLAVAEADCSAEEIVPGRLGCLDTNLPVAGNPGEDAITWEADYCSPGEGRFVFASTPHLIGIEGQDGGAIGRIDVYDPALTTAEGIHVGSTKAEVTAAYPATPAVVPYDGIELVVLSGPEGFVTIELADGWGAEALAVANIRIYAADQDPTVSVYGTENFAGACPFDF